MWYKSIFCMFLGYLSISKKARLFIYNLLMIVKLLFSFGLSKIYFYIVGVPSKHLSDVIYNDIINNGCFAIKLTQWVVSRYDMMYDDNRPEWIDKYKDLYEKCPVHSYIDTKTIFYESFHKPIESLIDIRDNTPIASGSIGQVYIGYLRETGQKVAIKVKHPNIDEQILVPKLILKCLLFREF